MKICSGCGVAPLTARCGWVGGTVYVVEPLPERIFVVGVLFSFCFVSEIEGGRDEIGWDEMGWDGEGGVNMYSVFRLVLIPKRKSMQ